MQRNILGLGLALTLAGIAGTACADEGGDWVVKAGVHTVVPESNNGRLGDGALKTDVGSDTRPTVTLEYLLNRNWGIEALAALPFEHEVNLNGAKAATVKHLPPTVSVQYHFNPNGNGQLLESGTNTERWTAFRFTSKLQVDDTLSATLAM